jgi:hypothetical protein
MTSVLHSATVGSNSKTEVEDREIKTRIENWEEIEIEPVDIGSRFEIDLEQITYNVVQGTYVQYKVSCSYICREYNKMLNGVSFILCMYACDFLRFQFRFFGPHEVPRHLASRVTVCVLLVKFHTEFSLGWNRFQK